MFWFFDKKQNNLQFFILCKNPPPISCLVGSIFESGKLPLQKYLALLHFWLGLSIFEINLSGQLSVNLPVK